MASVLVFSWATSAIAADAVPTVEVTGTVLDAGGQPIDVTSARVTEYETADGDGVITAIDVAADGTFTVSLRAWGTAELPARAVFDVFGVESEPVFADDGCWTTTTPFGTVELSVPGEVPVDPVAITVDRLIETGLCPPVTATPAPTPTRTPQGTASSTAVPGAGPTLPPTDALPGTATDARPTNAWAIVMLLFTGAFVALVPVRKLRKR